MNPDLMQILVDARIEDLGRTARAGRSVASPRRAARTVRRGLARPWTIEHKTARHA